MFEIGDDVVCIDDQFPAEVMALYNELPVLNTVYKVRDIDIGRLEVKPAGDGGHKSASFKVLLEGVNNPHDPSLKQGFAGELGFASHRFVKPEQLQITAKQHKLEPMAV